MFSQYVVQRASMSALDRSQVVTGCFKEANERRYAHVASRKRFHAGERRTCDTGALGQFLL
ncbi:hypothetical protein VL15_03155 [Burkholderia cepacia]|uniref:Uncharacterized protein n=1 Tax=Burkholderia cepacia TaxID=292 RepID=A0A0J5XD26_BURCE|nr:hypothetical protein VL15_03155 [Burkholderia cepacia]